MSYVTELADKIAERRKQIDEVKLRRSEVRAELEAELALLDEELLQESEELQTDLDYIGSLHTVGGEEIPFSKPVVEIRVKRDTNWTPSPDAIAAEVIDFEADDVDTEEKVQRSLFAQKIDAEVIDNVPRSNDTPPFVPIRRLNL